MATKHTQGPWTARGTLGPHSNPSLKGPCVVEAANGYVLATMNGWRNDEQEANAKLIAAAPTLLEVLQWIYDQAVWDDTDREVLIERTRDVIRLAIGEKTDSD